MVELISSNQPFCWILQGLCRQDSCRCCAGCALNPWPLCVLDVQIRKPLVSININLDTLWYTCVCFWFHVSFEFWYARPAATLCARIHRRIWGQLLGCDLFDLRDVSHSQHNGGFTIFGLGMSWDQRVSVVLKRNMKNHWPLFQMDWNHQKCGHLGRGEWKGPDPPQARVMSMQWYIRFILILCARMSIRSPNRGDFTKSNSRFDGKRKCYTVPDLSLTGYAECFWPLQLQAEIEAGMGRRQMFGRAGSHLKYSKPKAMLKKDTRWHHCTPTWSNCQSLHLLICDFVGRFAFWFFQVLHFAPTSPNKTHV